MFKAVSLLKSKPGLSREAFISYYETRHAPMILENLAHVRDYRRNYLDLDGAHIGPDATAPDFDVIMELWFADRAGFEADMARLADPQVSELIARDAEQFLDHRKTRFFVVEERISASSPQSPSSISR